MSSSCCNGNCGCGSGCKCGSSCSGCKRTLDLGFSGEAITAGIIIQGVAPENAYCEGAEMEMGAENGGCNYGAANCNGNCK
ncbi:hypothetical protein ACHQM5_021364 [Ranunculus cassubicifolius]